jgi:hypothetical protein
VSQAVALLELLLELLLLLLLLELLLLELLLLELLLLELLELLLEELPLEFESPLPPQPMRLHAIKSPVTTGAVRAPSLVNENRDEFETE